ncbi:DNA polymerase [Rhizobacter sp. Root1221]|uniref:DNA polymerase n=1 Tax=Rhizobacter sp. Root1221 TaxID=1736433 RepID=UPI000701B2F0|nr:DNA polymerase [Rhizobacter sp. Root1221]
MTPIAKAVRLLLTHAVTFDLETDGLLDEVSVIHVLVIKDRTTGIIHRFNNQPGGRPIAEGLAILADPSTLVVAHNGTGYDCLVLKKLHGLDIPWWRQRDTMVLSRLVWPHLKQVDLDRRKKKSGASFPGQLIGSVSLEAWGHRLGEHKGDYAGDPLLVERLMAEGVPEKDARKTAYARRWERWNQSMEDYCVQDVVVTDKLYDRILSKEPSETSVLIETQVQHIIVRQEAHGFLLDEKKAVQLYTTLVKRKLELEAEVHAVFKPMFLRFEKPFTPARDNKGMGYVAGAPFQKLKLTDFNLSSRDHISHWLKVMYGWEPVEFTSDGKPKVDDEVISALPYAEAKPLKEYFMVVKRIAQIAEGNEAWLKHVRKDGRVHGRVNTNGAVTGRMTHSKPNMAQVPSGKSEYGNECRECWIVPVGKKLVGADADALELRDLAGYMAIYDGGAYIKTVLEGDKSKGTDMHSVNCMALGLPVKEYVFGTETGRDVAKTWFYAFIYGSGDENLGWIVLRKKGAQAKKKGAALRKAFLANLPAMGKLVQHVQARAKERGFLKGIDGRLLPVRSMHSALNTLLQSAGAIQMKKALCLLDESLQEAGLIPGTHYEFVANVHDEWQIEVDDDKAEMVGRMAVQSIRDAGSFFNFRCPLDGAFDVGNNWSETH